MRPGTLAKPHAEHVAGPPRTDTRGAVAVAEPSAVILAIAYVRPTRKSSRTAGAGS